MSKSNLKTNLEYLIARVMLALFRLLPLRVAIWLGGRLVGLVYHFSGRLRRVGQRNLALAFPERPEEERQRLLRDSFTSLGRLFGIFSHFSRRNHEAMKRLILPEGLPRLKAAQEEGRGMILFTGHVGAWELSSFALSLFGHPLSFLVRRIDNPKIEELVESARMSLGNRTIDKRSAAREMLQLLQNRGTLGILVDLNTLDREAIFVDFFGVPASTTFIVAKLALRTGVPLLPVFAPWDEREKKFVLRIDEPIKFEPTGDETEDVRQLTQAYTRVVENYVRRYPDQWLWIHRRWKTRPPDEPAIY
jgi:KDO2-lipid IV(A) lauroyltransferase